MATYNYSRYSNGQDYIFSAIDSNQAYLTAQGGNPQVGDFLILKLNHQTYRYEIRHIDYYCNPSDMWIALIQIKSAPEERTFPRLTPLIAVEQCLRFILPS